METFPATTHRAVSRAPAAPESLRIQRFPHPSNAPTHPVLRRRLREARGDHRPILALAGGVETDFRGMQRGLQASVRWLFFRERLAAC
jgi:hypothetical protein